MVAELTALPVANASLLDEATAAAEAMHMALAVDRRGRKTFFVSDDCHPQTIAVVRTHAEPLGVVVEVGPVAGLGARDDFFGVLLQYPTSDGRVLDYRDVAARAH